MGEWIDRYIDRYDNLELIYLLYKNYGWALGGWLDWQSACFTDMSICVKSTAST